MNLHHMLLERAGAETDPKDPTVAIHREMEAVFDPGTPHGAGG